MRTNKYGCSLIIFFLSVYMHTAVLLDNACLENLSSNLLVIYDAHIKPHTCVKELSFQLNWNWEPPWSLGCLCCWKSWSLPHYLKEGKKITMSQQDKTNCWTVIFSDAETLTDSCKCKNVGSTKLCLLFLAAPCRGQHSRSSASISAYPLHLPVTPTLSMSTGLLHLRHPLSNISTIPPLRMSKLSQPCLSFFVSKLHDPSCPYDILLSNLIHSGHPYWENLNMSSSAIHT